MKSEKYPYGVREKPKRTTKKNNNTTNIGMMDVKLLVTFSGMASGNLIVISRLIK